MKKSIWIFLLAVLLPGVVLGWLALRSAGEQQIIFERRTAELYQKETEDLAAAVRETVEGERRAFSDVVHRLLGKSDAQALARDFTNTLTDAWSRKAVGFVIGPDGQMLSPGAALAKSDKATREFLWENSSFLCSTQPAVVYPVPVESSGKAFSYGKQLSARGQNFNDLSQVQQPMQEREAKPALIVGKGGEPIVLTRKSGTAALAPSQQVLMKEEAPPDAPAPSPEPKQESAIQTADVLVKQKVVALADRAARVQTPALPALDAAKATLHDEPMEAPKPRSAELFRDAGLKPGATGASVDKKAPAPKKPAPEMFAEKQTAFTAEVKLKRLGESETKGVAESAALGVVLEKGMKDAGPVAVDFISPADGEVKLGQNVDGLEWKDGFAGGLGSERRRLDTWAVSKADDKLYDAEGLKRITARFAIPEDKSALGFGAAPASETRAEQPEEQKKQVEQLDAKKLYSFAAPAQSAGQQPAGFTSNNAQLFNRQVEPQQNLRAQTVNLSVVIPSNADFNALTATGDEGMVSRFVQDKLGLIFWIRPPEAPELIFGCLIEAANLHELWAGILGSGDVSARDGSPSFILALLDDKARPVTSFPVEEKVRDWKRPFVASEVGEVLPHWETALYLATPTALADTARALRRTLSFTIVAAVALIAIGGWLVVADVRRQLALAQKKTDFVSNVSHELKTPLTSIRMFAELMHDRPPPAEKQGQYLRIISAEAERLTRLINNVLDFAKLERRQKRFEKKPINLHPVIARVWESHEMHLRDAGFTTKWEAAAGPYPVTGDEDALSQILVNLLSNAEKYSADQKDIELITWLDSGAVHVSILDRGLGVPEGEEKKIFESFYRAHDSLSSGIQGSGLGLTLAQRLAAEHGGGITHERREGGGSRFTLRLPVTAERNDE